MLAIFLCGLLLTVKSVLLTGHAFRAGISTQVSSNGSLTTALF